MRINQFILSAFLLAFAGSPAISLAADGATSTLRAILIMASNEKAPADPKLAPYEAPLQRNLPESSFRYVGEGSAAITGNGRGTITLARGHRLELEGDKAGGGDPGTVRVKVQWLNGSELVIGIILNLHPGVPAVLGRRPSGDGEVPIVLVVAK
jgi:hypothetical protein